MNENSIYLDLYNLTRYLYKVHHGMAKEYKYTLGNEMMGYLWKCLDTVILADFLPNKDKYPKILKASILFDCYKIRLRMIFDLKLITSKQHAYVIKENEKIGRMISGWMRWSKSH